MSSKKKNVFSIGLIGLAAIPIATSVSSTTDKTNANLDLQKVWKLKDSTTITQKDVVDLLNKTNYQGSNIDFESWKETSVSGNHEDFSRQKDFPSGYKIPSTVAKIDSQAFAGIKFPDNFEIPKTITEIGSNAFDNAILSKGFKFVPTISIIKERTFDHAKIYSLIDVPLSVTSIEEYAFKNAIFHKNVLIHKTVLSIGTKAFQNAIFHDVFNFLPELEEKAPTISKDFLSGATFKRSSLFFLPFKEIPSVIFKNVTFPGEEDIVIGNGNGFFVEKLKSLKGIKEDTLKFLKIPRTVLKIERQSELSEKIANDLYKQVESNIIEDVLNKFEDILKDWPNKNTLNIDNELKKNLPSLSVESIRMAVKASLSSIIKDNFGGDKPNYVIGDSDLKDAVLEKSPLKDVDLFFKKGFITITPDDAAGKVILKVAFELKVENEKLSKKYKKVFSNFKRKIINSDVATVDDIIFLFNDLKNKTDGTTSTLEKRNTLLPSDLVNESIPDSLGFVDPTLNKRNGAEVSFKVKENNNDDGKLVVEVSVKKGDIEKKVEFILKDFQTTTQKATADANGLQTTNLGALQAAFNGGSVLKPNDKASDIAQRITNAQTLKEELGIDLTNLVSTSTYAISATGNIDGKISVSVVMETLGATTPLSATQTLDVNHKSDATLAKEVADQDIAAIKQALDQLNDTNSSLENRATTLPSLAVKTPAGVGFNPPELNGANVKYVYNENDANGEITITATIIKGTGAPLTSIFTIKGFQTTVQAQRIANQAAINAVVVGDIDLPDPANDVLPSAIKKPNVQTINGVNITFTTWIHNNDQGTITWAARVTKGTGTNPKTFSGVLERYQNQAEHDVLLSITLVKELNNTLTTEADKLASSLDWWVRTPGPNDYGFIQPEFPSGVYVYYLLKEHDDVKGEVTVEATIYKGSSEKETNFVLKGFKTQNAKDLESLKKTIEELGNTRKEKTNEISSVENLPFNKEALESLADNAKFPDDIKGAKLSYSHNEIITDGNLTVNVKIVKNGEERTASFDVAIEGINQAKKDRGDIDAAQTAINNISDLDLETNNVKISEVENNDQLRFDQDVFTKLGGGNLPTLAKDLKLHYYHAEISEDGKLRVNVKISKGKVSSKIASFDVNVVGINIAKDIKSAKDLIRNIPNLNLVVNKDKIDAVLSNENKAFNQRSFESFGGSAFPTFPNDLVLKYSHPELNKNGQLVVNVNISRDTVSDSESFIVLVTGIDEFKAEVDRKTTTINEMKKINHFTFSHEKQKMPSELSASIEDHITLEAFTGAKLLFDLQDREKIKIVAEHNDDEGKLKLKIKVIPHGTTEENAEEIEKDVLGLTTKAQRDVQISEANKVIENVKAAIKAKLHQTKVWKDFKNKYPSSLKKETNPIKIGFNSYNSPNGVDVTYELIKADDVKGKAKVRATIKKEYGRSQIVDFHLQGYKKGVGKFSRLAITLISTGAASIFGILILFFKTLFKKSTKKTK